MDVVDITPDRSHHAPGADGAAHHGRREGRPRPMFHAAWQRLKWPLATAASSVLYYSGLLWLYERLKPAAAHPRITILMYHRVVDDCRQHRRLCISTKTFREHMRYLARSRYQLISLSTLLRYLRGEEQLTQDCVAVTFDDGYRDVFINAYPVLKELRIPATIFLTTGFVDSQQTPWWDRLAVAVRKLRSLDGRCDKMGTGSVAAGISPENRPAGKVPVPILSPESIPPDTWNRIHAAVAGSSWRAEARLDEMVESLKRLDQQQRSQLIDALERIAPPEDADPLMLTWEMIRAMRGELITFGAHTVSHAILGQIDAEAARREILASKARIEGILGESVSFFAYPDGRIADVSERTVQLVKDGGYKLAVTGQSGANDHSADPLLLKRWGPVDVPACTFAVRLRSLLMFA